MQTSIKFVLRPIIQCYIPEQSKDSKKSHMKYKVLQEYPLQGKPVKEDIPMLPVLQK